MGYPDWVPDEERDDREEEEAFELSAGFDFDQWLAESDDTTEFNWGGDAATEETDDAAAAPSRDDAEAEVGDGLPSAGSVLPGREAVPDRAALADSPFIPKSMFVPTVVVALVLILAVPALVVSVPWGELVPVQPDASDDGPAGTTATATPRAGAASGGAGTSTADLATAAGRSTPTPRGGTATATSNGPVDQRSFAEDQSTDAATARAAGLGAPASSSLSTNAVTATDEPPNIDESSEIATATDRPSSETATATDRPDDTATATEEPTATATDQPSVTATADPTATATPTETPTATATDRPTATPTETPTATAAPTATAEPTATPTETATPTDGVLDPITELLS